jgi:hypothetical protein
MFGEIIAGISLVNAAADQIKKLVGTAKDVSQLSQHIDSLLEGEDQIHRTQKMAHERGIGSITSVANEVLDARLADERHLEMTRLIDARFGWGTMDEIIKIRNDRLSALEAAEKKLLKKRKKQKEDALLALSVIMAVLSVGSLIVGGLWWYKQ